MTDTHDDEYEPWRVVATEGREATLRVLERANAMGTAFSLWNDVLHWQWPENESDANELLSMLFAQSLYKGVYTWLRMQKHIVAEHTAYTETDETDTEDDTV